MATRQGTGSTRGFVRTALLVSLLGAGYLAWLLSDVGSPRAEVVVGELVFVAAPLYAAWSCWGAHRRDHATHTAWWWLTVGCLTWAVGSVTFATYQVVLGRVPIPSLADVGYVRYAVPVALGIMRFRMAGASGRAGGRAWTASSSPAACC